MSRFKVNSVPDYVKQFKENFIGGLLGEDDIDDETLEDVCSSVEKEDSASKCSTPRGMKAESKNAGSKVRKNLFGPKRRGLLNNEKSTLSTYEKNANYKNIQHTVNRDSDEEILFSQELNGDSVRLSQAIINSPGKFFGSGGSPASLIGRETTPKRKRSPQKLSKYSPFSKKARALRESGSPSIKNYFSVIKTSWANSELTNESNLSSTKLQNSSENMRINKESNFSKVNNGESSNTLPKMIESEILPINPTDSKVVLSSPIKSIPTSSPMNRNECRQLSSNSILNETVFRTPEKPEHNVSPSTSKKSTPKSPKQPFVDTYNSLLLRILSEVYINTTPIGQVICLLSSEEDNYMQAFNTLPTRLSAQRIYGRLLSRKYDWIRVSTMKYSKVTNNLIQDLEVLENYGLVTLDNSTEPIDVLCNYLTLPELKSICQFLNVSQIKSGNKADIIDQITIRYKQKPITSFYKKETGHNNLVKEKVLSTLGKCVKLTEGPRKTMFRCLLFFSYPHFRGLEKERFQHQLDLIRAWSNDEAKYPQYNVLRTNIFPSREHFLEYEAALELKSDLLEQIERKDWDEALHRVLLAIEKYEDFVQNSERMCWAKQLPDFLRRFTAGAVYVSSINKGIDVLRKYKEYIDQAEHCLRILLDQDLFSVHRRGQWFERLALVCQRNCKSNEKAATVVFEGLKNKPKLDIVSRHVLSARATLLIGRKTNKINDISKDSLRSIVEPDLSEPFTVQISEQVLPSNKAGRKQIYIQDSEGGKTLLSVEDVARSHFRKQGYTQGRHDEGATIKALVLACFWDIIYGEVDVEGGHSLFHSGFQNAPLDWNTEGFYLRRKEAIELRLELLLSGGVDLWTTIETCYNENGMMESVVPWNCLHESLHIVKGLVECLDIKSFAAIARLLLTNYPTYHSGFPDLTLWDPLQKKCLFVEVKSPNDTLSTKQKLWLHNLKEFSVNSLVCHVNSVGCKSKKKADSST